MFEGSKTEPLKRYDWMSRVRSVPFLPKVGESKDQKQLLADLKVLNER